MSLVLRGLRAIYRGEMVAPTLISSMCERCVATVGDDTVDQTNANFYFSSNLFESCVIENVKAE